MTGTRPFKAIAPRMISVCMFCHPGETILDLYPRLRGRVEISHGLCTAHKSQWMTEIKEMSNAK